MFLVQKNRVHIALGSACTQWMTWVVKKIKIKNLWRQEENFYLERDSSDKEGAWE